jgi:glycogen debranching enzyme
MAAMARRLKRPADARRYAEAADRSLEALHRHLWDERAGWFGVRHADGTLDSRVGVPGLFPLAYGLATGRQARAARRPFERLLCRYGVRTFARGQRGYSETYWRGPVWATSILYGVAAARRYYPGLVGRIKEGLVSYCLAHPGIWELLEGDSGEVAATDYGFLAGVVYGGASMCGAAALIAATRILDGHNFFP